MLKMGVPTAAVELKMKAEGLSQDKIDCFVSVVDPSRAAAKTSSPAFKLKAKTLPTLKVHWNTIAGDKLEKSVWATPRAEHKNLLQADEIQELTSLFAAKVRGAGESHCLCDSSLKHLFRLTLFRDSRRQSGLLRSRSDDDPLCSLRRSTANAPTTWPLDSHSSKHSLRTTSCLAWSPRWARMTNLTPRNSRTSSACAVLLDVLMIKTAIVADGMCCDQAPSADAG